MHFTREQLLHSVNDATRKLNPDLYPVARPQNTQREHDERGQKETPPLAGSSRSVGYRITIISVRTKLVDGHDNLRTGAKPLVDRIATWLSYSDDSHPDLEWTYAQVVLPEQQGTIVKIQQITKKQAEKNKATIQ